MQLSNQPAEALAKKLVDSSKGAFALCGFASGGKDDSSTVGRKRHVKYNIGSEAMESVLKLARQACF
jgi:acetylornithine/succinyldiaminopimelate/putrescine aminotransferase